AELHHLADAFEPRRERELGPDLVLPARDEGVGEVAADGAKRDADLASPGFRRGQLLSDERLGPAQLSKDHSVHGGTITRTRRGAASRRTSALALRARAGGGDRGRWCASCRA